MDASDVGAGLNRRGFVRATGAVLGAGAALASAGELPRLHPARIGASRLGVGVIGCGGRGTGAAMNILEASADTEVVALADVFRDRLDSARRELANSEGFETRARVSDDRCFVGFDAYERLLAIPEVDIVVLATPPGFRPRHFEAAVAAGKHVFFEKPVAVDPAGVRLVLAAAEQARQKGLSVVAGTQRRHERSYQETIQRLRDGAAGRLLGARCFWNQGGLWMHPRQPAWSDMEWQLRNWLYFTWLSGDHICEQHVHNLDVVNWTLGATPVRCTAQGGRQVRTDPAFGHIYDHFAVLYEYPGEVFVTSMCRQIAGCASAVEEGFTGTEGSCRLWPGHGEISGSKAWKFAGTNPNPYVEEQRALVEAITSGKPINEAVAVAESTLTAIMGRMSAYTGKPVTWEQALNSKLDLWPGNPEMGTIPVPEVAVPGKTPLI